MSNALQAHALEIVANASGWSCVSLLLGSQCNHSQSQASQFCPITHPYPPSPHKLPMPYLHQPHPSPSIIIIPTAPPKPKAQVKSPPFQQKLSPHTPEIHSPRPLHPQVPSRPPSPFPDCLPLHEQNCWLRLAISTLSATNQTEIDVTAVCDKLASLVNGQIMPISDLFLSPFRYRWRTDVGGLPPK